MDVAVIGDYAYVVGYLIGVDSGMLVIDVSDPTAPVTVGFYDTIWPMRVAVAGTHAYVADHETGLRIVDVSNPAEPVEVGSYDTLGPAAAVAVAGSYAYVADVGYGLRVINISDPQEPFEVGFCDWFEVWDEDDLAVAGGYVYYRSWGGLLRVIDISNPEEPFEVGYAYGFGLNFSVEGSYVYVQGEWGLDILTSCEGLVFQDGFESGDAGAWSPSLP